jgi:hypothetical protein
MFELDVIKMNEEGSGEIDDIASFLCNVSI